MSTLTWIAWQLLSYGPLTWLSLVAVAFASARFMGWFGVPVSFLIVAIIIYILDVRWVVAAMQDPRWDGAPDMDMIFMFGVFTRVVLVNAVLLPLTIFGLRRRRQRQRREFFSHLKHWDEHRNKTR